MEVPKYFCPELSPGQKEAARRNRNEYMKRYMQKYRREHPERVKSWNAAYWARKAQNWSD